MWQLVYKVRYHVVVILCFELVSHDESFTTNLRLLNIKQCKQGKSEKLLRPPKSKYKYYLQLNLS